MAGYSRLMERDELDVLTRQKVHRTELFDPEIELIDALIVDQPESAFV